MKITTYAPVIIPTLNRYDHFVRCLESLEKCSGAMDTDVFVALDYPPSKKYVEGWEKINHYLKAKEKKCLFKSLTVIRREKNYGVGHPKANEVLLSDEIAERFDSFIFSEDDNVFAPCFLMYMNKCLEKFKEDSRIIVTCGYNFCMEFPEMYLNNYYFSKSGCAWGVGFQSNRWKELKKYYNLSYLSEIIRDKGKYNLLVARHAVGISHIHSMLKLGKLHGDAIWEIACALEDKYFILPTVSKVRNFGNDGTGVHSLKSDPSQNKFYSEQPIDESETFDFTDDIFTYEPVYLKRNNYKSKITLRSIYKALVVKLDIWLLRKFNYMPKSKYI